MEIKRLGNPGGKKIMLLHGNLMCRLGIDPKSSRHILITHQDTDHVGAAGYRRNR